MRKQSAGSSQDNFEDKQVEKMYSTKYQDQSYIKPIWYKQTNRQFRHK